MLWNLFGFAFSRKNEITPYDMHVPSAVTDNFTSTANKSSNIVTISNSPINRSGWKTKDRERKYMGGYGDYDDNDALAAFYGNTGGNYRKTRIHVSPVENVKLPDPTDIPLWTEDVESEETQKA